MSQIIDRSSDKSNRLTVQEAAELASQFFPSKNVEVLNLDSKPFSSERLGYLGLHELLTIEVRDHDADPETAKKTLTFFVKAVVPTCNAFDQLIFREESKFYRDVMPRLLSNYKSEKWGAECYMTRENFFVLENLKDKGFKVISETLSVDYIKSALICTARFHASSMLLEDKLQRPLSEVFPGFFKEKVFLNDDNGYSWKWLLTGIEVVEAVSTNFGSNPKYPRIAYDLSLEKFEPKKGEKNVLCHEDLWANNIMFKEENGVISCRIVDFQMTAYTSYVIDLVMLIYLNIRRENRQKIERELIEVYHKELKETLLSHGLPENKILTLEKVIQDFEDKRICGIISAAQFFPIALLNKDLALEYSKDPVQLEKYMYESRKDFVMRAMELDIVYKKRIEEIMQELMQYMHSKNQ